MIYNILRNNIVVAQVKPLSSSNLFQRKQQSDEIRLNFELVDFIEIKIGDYISFEKTEQLYYINKKPKVIHTPANHKYECIFEGSIGELKKTKIFFETPKIGGGTYNDYKFPLTGTAQSFLDFIVQNLNREGTGWSAGSFEDTSSINIEFNNWNAFESISEITSKLGISWNLQGKELNFTDSNFQTPHVFRVGRFQGFRSLSRLRVESENIETVVYGYGSTKNLPPRTAESGLTYDGPLLTENRLAFSGVDGESKLIKNVDKYGIRESIQEFEEIKPERIGAVTGIVSGNLFQFIDSTIDFDPEDQKITGVVPKLKFISGQLLGLEFNFSFEYSSKIFTLDPYSDESGIYPNDLTKIQSGDQYVMFDIIMPLSYITEAQQRLQDATQAYLDEKSDGLDIYEGEVDEVYIDKANIELNLGDVVRIISIPFLLDSYFEIKELEQSITNPNKYRIKFGDVLPKSILARILGANFETQQQIFNIQKSTYTSSQTTNNITNVLGQEITWESL